MSVNKVQLANGETIIDISDSTVTPETLAEGVTAHDASGQKITGKMVPGGNAPVQTDWNQTDETAPDFLKNKPFGDVLEEIMPVTELTVALDHDLGMYLEYIDLSFLTNVPSALQISFNGIKYECAVAYVDGAYNYGNMGFFDMVDTGEPFLLMLIPEEGLAMLIVLQEGSYSVGIKSIKTEIINPKFVNNTVAFYTNTNESTYIYVDSTCTTKATIEDIAAVGTRDVVVDIMDSGVRILRSSVAFMTTNELALLATGYCELVIYTKQGDNVGTITLYTAEYTPPTT